MSRRFPVPESRLITGIEWIGDAIPYEGTVGGERVRGDTYPVTWAADGELYTAAGDPHWGASRWGLDVERVRGVPPGHVIEKVNPMIDYGGWGGAGPKPTGMICVDGALHLAYQNLRGLRPPAVGGRSQHGSDAVICRSTDGGATWKPDIKDLGFGTPTFPGSRFGGPAFVNVGRDNAGARDGFVHAVSTDQWDNGGHLLLGRAPKDRLCDGTAWEWVCHVDAANVPAWTTELDRAQAVLSDDRWISLPEMVFLPGLDRYLLLTWRLNEDFSPDHGSQLVVYEAPEPWGPFALAHHEPAWERRELTPYCPRVPLKWLDGDGRGGWLLFSGSWAAGLALYGMHVRRFRLRLR
jgi:hypothetical protein